MKLMYNILWTAKNLYNNINNTYETPFKVAYLSVSEDVVGYLPEVNAPATEMSIFQVILCRSIKIMCSLQLEKMCCFV